MARPAILAGVRCTIVHVQFAILPLEAFGALAGVAADQVFTGGAVLAGGGFALVDLLLAVGACVTVEAVATVRVADVFASAIVAE